MNDSVKQVTEALTLAVELYGKHIASAGIHENRFPSWQELDSNAKRFWLDTATSQLEKKNVSEEKGWQEYSGTKSVLGKPMQRGEYNHARGWETPADENPSDEGYMLQYLDGGKPNTEEYPHYVSWSPKSVFDKSYKLTVDGMGFDMALRLIKMGKQVTRTGWNAGGQFVYLLPASKLQSAIGYGFGEYIGEPEFVQTIVLKNAQNKLVVGWVPSIGDLFAEDWKLLD